MSTIINLLGHKYGRLTVLSFVGLKPTRWKCQCSCGNSLVVSSNSLRRGNTKSCGCYKLEQVIKRSTIHGHARRGFNTGTYNSWQSMIHRCTNSNFAHYEDYGGRGIKVCDKWLKFENFLQDMGPKPVGTSLDRINNNGNYEPSNCRWASKLEQVANKRSQIRNSQFSAVLKLLEEAHHEDHNHSKCLDVMEKI